MRLPVPSFPVATRTVMRSLLAVVLGLSTGVILQGCEDDSARDRRKAQETIDDAAARFTGISTLVNAGDPDSLAVARTQLSAMGTSLSTLRGGTGGQRSAAALLAADAWITLAALDHVEMQDLSSLHTLHRFEAHGLIDALLHFDTMLAGVSRNESTRTQDMLASRRRTAVEEYGRYDAQMETLDEPINALEAQISSDTDHVAILSSEANALRRSANELGFSAGLSRFEQAIELEREADGYEYEIAIRESNLKYDLSSRYALAKQRREIQSLVLDDIRNSIETLMQYDQLINADSQSTRQRVEAIVVRITDIVIPMTTDMEGEVATLQARALANLDTASVQALLASSKGRHRTGHADRIIEARTAIMKGEIEALRARSLSDHAHLHAHVAEAGSLLPGIPEAGIQAAALAEAAAAAHAAATGHFENARTILKNIQGSAVILPLLRALDMEIVALGGAPVLPAPAAPVSPSGAGATGEPSTTTGGASSAYPSPEALVDAANQWAQEGGSDSDIEAFLRMVYCNTETSTQMKSALLSIARPVRRLRDSVRTHLGTEALAQLDQENADEGGGLGGIGFSDVELLSETSDTAVVRVITIEEDGSETNEQAMLIRRPEGWMIDGSSIFRDDDEEIEMAIGMLPMLAQMVSRMVDAVIPLIESGDITSIEQLKQLMESPSAPPGGFGPPGNFGPGGQ